MNRAIGIFLKVTFGWPLFLAWSFVSQSSDHLKLFVCHTYCCLPTCCKDGPENEPRPCNHGPCTGFLERPATTLKYLLAAFSRTKLQFKVLKHDLQRNQRAMLRSFVLAFFYVFSNEVAVQVRLSTWLYIYIYMICILCIILWSLLYFHNSTACWLFVFSSGLNGDLISQGFKSHYRSIWAKGRTEALRAPPMGFLAK